jgi:hypothetical protein
MPFFHATPIYEALVIAIPESTCQGIVALVIDVEWATLRVIFEI